MLAKEVREEWITQLAAAPAEAAIYRLQAAQARDPWMKEMNLNAAKGVLRQAEILRKRLANG